MLLELIEIKKRERCSGVVERLKSLAVGSFLKKGLENLGLGGCLEPFVY